MNDVSRCNYLVEYIHPSIVTAIQSGNVGAVRSALDQFFSKKPISRTVYRNHPKDIFKYAKCIGNVKIIEFLESYLF
ncbi:hypothetical protein M1446_01705 [Candidatus Dependentiae bacterium]|nr:hypothetical protein [Candidatus Dependentiae bacterium]